MKSLRKVPYKIAITGTLVAVIFWVFEGTLHRLVFDADTNPGVIGILVPSDPNELWMRAFIFSLILSFSLYVQSVVMKLGSAEALLRASENRYRDIVETAEEGIWILDKANRVFFVNRKMAGMLGYSVDEVKGRHIFEFMDEEERKVCGARLEASKRGERDQYEIRLRRNDGSALWVLVSGAPYLDEAGEYAGALAMATDITGRKKSEEALSERVEELERFRKATVERGFRIKELKETVAKLEGVPAKGPEEKF